MNAAQPVPPELNRAAVWLAGLYTLILLPILRADRLYNDDLKRALFGRTGWDSNGRPLTTLLMKLLQCYDHALVDISPFTQLASGAVLVWTGMLVARRFCRSSPVAAALFTFPLGAQPFFLENLSYKFDALSMAVALMTALLPFALPQAGRRAWWLGVLSLFACMNFYQPAFNAFLVFVILEAAVGAVERTSPRAIGKTLRFRLGQLLLSALSYELVVGIHLNGWVKQKSIPIETIAQVPQVVANLSHFLAYVGASFNEHWWMYFGPLLGILAGVAAFAVAGCAIELRGKQSKWLVAAFAVAGLLLPALAVAASLGPLLLLADPPIAPRVLVGLGALLSAALISFDAALRAWKFSPRWATAAGTMLAAGFCIIASAYGNASAEQKSFEEHIARQLADDIADTHAHYSIRSILLDGNAGYSRLTAHVADELPLVGFLIPPYLNAADRFHTHIFLVAYLPEFTDLRLDATPATREHNAVLLDAVCGNKPVFVRGEYRIYVDEDVALVLLGSAYESRCDRGVDG